MGAPWPPWLLISPDGHIAGVCPDNLGLLGSPNAGFHYGQIFPIVFANV